MYFSSDPSSLAFPINANECSPSPHNKHHSKSSQKPLSKMSSSPQHFVLALILLFSVAQAIVPDSETFKFVNEGEFGDYVVEYNANYRVLSPYTFPFQLCFYNTTPGAYTLALRMGTVRSESLMRWVWEANRDNAVGENATFSLGKDGNLVLAEADGDVVWQTATANKGVVGFKILPTGNMVLYDSKGKFLWQSFDSPTDTLLVGQTLRVGGPTSLVSRASPSKTGNGMYSLSLQPQSLALYNNTENIPTVLIQIGRGTLEYVRFNSDRKTSALRLEYKVAKSSTKGALTLSKPGFNTTLTYLRLGIDANLKAYTYDTRTEAGSWKETYALFK